MVRTLAPVVALCLVPLGGLVAAYGAWPESPAAVLEAPPAVPAARAADPGFAQVPARDALQMTFRSAMEAAAEAAVQVPVQAPVLAAAQGPVAAAQAVPERGLGRDRPGQREVAASARLRAEVELVLAAVLDPGPAAAPPLRPEFRPLAARDARAFAAAPPSLSPRLRPDDLLTPRPPATLAGASDLLCMAVAIYHEARNQPLDGQLAVASVILNRTQEPERWGRTPCEVVAPGQFSFLTGPADFPPILEREAWAIAVEMAREALEHGPSPLVQQADHYHTLAVEPVWNDRMRQVITIDDHIFFIDPTTQG